MIPDPAPIFVLWERTVADLLERTARFPKTQRFTFAQRVDNLAIDLLESLAEAQFARGPHKRALLAKGDAQLLRLRVVLRLCHTRRLVDSGGYEHLARSIDEVGRMLGGWRRQQEEAQA